jgi:16S rRNA (cytidine1402-2'-O)-methyltransferase
MQNKGILYLIPCFLHEDAGIETLSPEILSLITTLDYFLTEEPKTTRRFISSLKLGKTIENLKIFTFDKDCEPRDVQPALDYLKAGGAVGLLSEAGCPGIADPGAKMVAWAHQNEIEVKALVGPSSILLALMSSGFNGQSFVFHGYVPVETSLKIKALKDWENLAFKTSQTQIFMDTPYRNDNLLDFIIQHLNPETYLSISVDLTGINSFSKTLKLKNWIKEKPSLHKRPAMFLIGRV